MLKLTSFLILLSLTLSLALANDGGGVSVDGIDGDGGDGADANSRQGNNTRANNLRYVPVGIQQFSRAYPKTHFRFISGDILSSTFFEMTGLFGFAAGMDPLEKSLDRTSTAGRHAGLITFVSTATVGGKLIDAAEKKVNKKLGITESSKKISALKRLSGLNILAGVYSYVVASSLIDGKSEEEIMKVIGSRDMFVSAISMHLAFLGADITNDTRKQVQEINKLKKLAGSSRAMQVMAESGLKSGLGLYKDLITDAKKMDEYRRKMSKGKVALGLAQPETIPALVAGTAVEWTAYYVFAKVWDKIIHDKIVAGLYIYDKHCASSNGYESFEYGMNQKGLVYDSVLIDSAENITKNFSALAQLLYSKQIEEQVILAQKTEQLSYILSLFDSYLNMPTEELKKEFLIGVLDPKSEMRELNEIFINYLLEDFENNTDKDLDIDRLRMAHGEIHLVENPSLYPAPIDRTGLGTYELSRIVKKGRLGKNKRIRDEILSKLVSHISTDEDKLLSAFDQEVEKLSEEQNEWSEKTAKISGMDLQAIENSYQKYNLDPNIPLEESEMVVSDELEAPETIFEIVLVQNLYLNQLRDLAYFPASKTAIEQQAAKSDAALMLQAKSLELVSP